MNRRASGPLRLFALLVAAAATTPSPAAAGHFRCGDVAEPLDTVTASDALTVLRSAVGLGSCPLCSCDADGNRKISAPDALFTLKAAVGQAVELACPFCCELCDCTPQALTLELEDVSVCEDCIPRVPTSNSDVDSIRIEFSGDVNNSYLLEAVDECVWQLTFPGAIASKVLYGIGNSTCSGDPHAVFEDGSIELRVVRTADGWQAFVGQYAEALEWGDFLRASIASSGCDAGGAAPSANAQCELAEIGAADDYDVHAVGGLASLSISDPAPVCP